MGNLIIRNGGSLTIQGDSLSILDTTLQSGQMYQQGDVYYGFTDFSEYTTFDHGDSNPNSDLVEWRAYKFSGTATSSISVGNDATYGNYVAHKHENRYTGFPGASADADAQGVVFKQFGLIPNSSSIELLSLVYAEIPMATPTYKNTGYHMSATSNFISSSITPTDGFYHWYHGTGTLNAPPPGNWATATFSISGSNAAGGYSQEQFRSGYSILQANDMPHWIWVRFQWYWNTSTNKFRHRYKMWTGSYSDEPSTYWDNTGGTPIVPLSTSDWFDGTFLQPPAPGYLAAGKSHGYGYYAAEGRIAYLSFSTDSGSVPAPPPPAGL